MSEYTTCMGPWMKGPKELAPGASSMCVGAKVCTGKAKNKEEAIEICQATPPKEPKARGSSRGLNAEAIANCLFPQLDSVGTIKELAQMLVACSSKSGGTKIKKPDTRNKFFKTCMAEGTVKGNFAEQVKLTKICEQKWKATHQPASHEPEDLVATAVSLQM